MYHGAEGATPEALPLCPSTNQNGCYTSIKEIKQGKNKFWVIEAQAPGNGLWGW